jgi:hypothetical protein
MPVRLGGDRAMKSLNVRHTVVLKKRKTSIILEDDF